VPILYRAALLPLSDDGVAIDHVLGAANHRTLLADEPASTARISSRWRHPTLSGAKARLPRRVIRRPARNWPMADPSSLSLQSRLRRSHRKCDRARRGSNLKPSLDPDGRMDLTSGNSRIILKIARYSRRVSHSRL